MRARSLTIVSLLLLGVFAVLAAAVSFSPALNLADLQAAAWVNGLDLGGALNSLLVASSLYGREYLWVAVVVVMLAVGDRRTKELALGLCAVFLVGIVAGEVSKLLIARERPATYVAELLNASGMKIHLPFILRVTTDADFSFPSGHALIVSIGAAYCLATFRKRWVAGLLTLEAALVCLSRVYVGTHYPTDVVAGIVLGTAIALGGIVSGRRYFRAVVKKLVGYLLNVAREGPLRL